MIFLKGKKKHHLFLLKVTQNNVLTPLCIEQYIAVSWYKYIDTSTYCIVATLTVTVVLYVSTLKVNIIYLYLLNDKLICSISKYQIQYYLNFRIVQVTYNTFSNLSRKKYAIFKVSAVVLFINVWFQTLRIFRRIWEHVWLYDLWSTKELWIYNTQDVRLPL